MKSKVHLLKLFTVASALLLANFAHAKDSAGITTNKPLVQIAILLDTSGSMGGLIEQAKGQLWKIVNEFARARQRGVSPEVQVALYEYGKSSLAAQSGWLRQIQPLTTDLDKISEELFGLKTNGGDEYCGWVIKEAVQNLAWSASSDVYKVIFIAGNEPFTQGPVDYEESCKAAIAKGIIVNTIHCGNEREGIDTKWKDGAVLADGKYLVIDHNQAVVQIEAPQDQEIARLSGELNHTYLAYGVNGKAGAERQARQEVNAATLAPASGAVVQRAVTKASMNYHNESWDLVDALKQKDLKLAEVKREDLPAEMQKMNDDERKGYVEKKMKERVVLQAKINRLNEERNRYVAEQMKQRTAVNTLDMVVISAIHEQARARNFRFE